MESRTQSPNTNFFWIMHTSTQYQNNQNNQTLFLSVNMSFKCIHGKIKQSEHINKLKLHEDTSSKVGLKGPVHSKMKVLPTFTHPVRQFRSPVEHIRLYFKEGFNCLS